MLSEPSVAALGGHSPWRIAKRLFLATRPMFFTASVLPVLLGAAWGWRVSGRFDGAVFLLALAAIVLLHGAGNVFNDVVDDASGNDAANTGRVFPFSGGSRFVQNGVMSRRQMALWGTVLLAAAAVPGAVLIARTWPGGLAVALIGVGLWLVYLFPPLRLSHRGLSETAVGVGFGVLPVAAAAWLQGAPPDFDTVLLSLPVALWIADVLLVNEVPDLDADRGAGKKTLVVLWGPAGARRLYLAANVAAAAALGVLVGRGVLAPWGMIMPAALVVVALRAAPGISAAPGRRPALVGAIKATLAIHLAGTLWLAGWALAA